MPTILSKISLSLSTRFRINIEKAENTARFSIYENLYLHKFGLTGLLVKV